MTLRYHVPLTAAEQIAAGLPEPQTLAIADRVRYAELDTQNHVNNKAYFTWFETLRVAYGERFCLPFFDRPPRVMLRGGEVRFLREILAGESYVVSTRAGAFRRSSYTLEQQIWAGDLRATFTCVMVMMHPDGRARCALPDPLREAFLTRDGARQEA